GPGPAGRARWVVRRTEHGGMLLPPGRGQQPAPYAEYVGQGVPPGSRVSPDYAYHLPSVPVPVSTSPLGPQERAAAARLLASAWPVAAVLGEIFARHGHQLAIVGGSVRDVFLRRRS